MQAYVVDARAALELARRGYSSSGDRELYAPTLLRSQVFSILHREVAAGDCDDTETLQLAERACRLPRRLLGDAVLRRTAWTIASDQGWPQTYDAEYIALTRLHGEALVVGSDTLRTKAASIVATETVDSFLAGTEAQR